MQDAIALTWETLNARVRNYRFGAFACLGLAALLAVLLILEPSWWVTGGIPVFLILGYVFVYRDQQLVFAWEDGVLGQWSRPDFVMGIFAQAIASHPGPLNNSLKTMVAALPADPDCQTPPPEKIRSARGLCRTRKALEEIRLADTFNLNFALAFAPLLITAFFHIRSPLRMYSFLPLALVPILENLLMRRTWKTWRNRMVTLGPMDPGESDAFSARTESLDWRRIPARWKARFKAPPMMPANGA